MSDEQYIAALQQKIDALTARQGRLPIVQPDGVGVWVPYVALLELGLIADNGNVMWSVAQRHGPVDWVEE